MIVKEQETLTVAQAIEQGYESCLYNEDGFQAMTSLKYPDDINFDRHPVLASQDSVHPTSPKADYIKGMIADFVQENWQEETLDDTNSVSEAIMELDFTDVEQRINAALRNVNYYTGTDIKLIP
jgi:hypothetical protein